MSTASGKLSPQEFLEELQRGLGRHASKPANTSELSALSGMNFDFSDLNAGSAKPAREELKPTASSATPSNFVEDKPPHQNPASTSKTDSSKSIAGNDQLSALFERVDTLLGPQPSVDETYCPKAPDSWQQAGITAEEAEKLTLKYLLARGSASGRQISQQTCLPFSLLDPVFKALKNEQILAHKGAAAAGDYEFILTDQGRDRARYFVAECSYFGAAPVPLRDYLKAMSAQSITKQHATEEDLRRALQDLIISPNLMDRLGPAINSGRGMFLFGEPGNGKTSIAERVISSFGSTIWIPKSLGIDGEIIRVFDPAVHQPVKMELGSGVMDVAGIDSRWIQIRRPTIVAGGELTMEELEIRQNSISKICEGPLQLKSNCGTLVIDDFGRQRMPVAELLNRWIVPLEKRFDYLNLPSGKKVQVPFDQLIIFSTNLEPRELVDGAFLRRIPYKIEVPDPTEEQFRQLFEVMAPLQGFQLDREAKDGVEYLIATYYRAKNRPFRACQPRDLLLQVKNFCLYKGLPRKITPTAFDFACENYFSVM